MPELSHKEQVDVVGKALELECDLAMKRADMELLKTQEFAAFPAFDEVFDETEPVEPQRRLLEPPPAPRLRKPGYGILEHAGKNWYWLAGWLGCSVASGLLGSVPILTTLLMLGSALSLIGFFVTYATARPTMIAARQAEVETKNQAAAAAYNQEVAAEQAKLDEAFRQELTTYHDLLLPQYTKEHEAHVAEYEEMRREYITERDAWEADKCRVMGELAAYVDEHERELAEVYDTSRIISTHYREIPLLSWLYEDMSSSDHDIRYATELLDRDRQRIATSQAAELVDDSIKRFRRSYEDAEAQKASREDEMMDQLYRLVDAQEAQVELSQYQYDTQRKVLFHERVGTAEAVTRIWRRHKSSR